MSDVPGLPTGELQTPSVEPVEGPEEVEPTEERERRRKKRRLRDIWVTGTEEPAWEIRPTDEGAQEMLAAPQMGQMAGPGLVSDYLWEEEAPDEETTIINMGPQHPSTHGVLRLQLELQGEIIHRAKPIVGYLHTGMEKTAETLSYMVEPTNVTRMDYLSPFFMELVFSLATERLLGIDVPPRAQAIRILMTELNRVASHLVWLATQGLDMGAISVMLYGFRERELLLDFFEKTTGLRMNHNYIRPGGVAAELHDGWEREVEEIVETIPTRLREYDDLLTENPIWLGRTVGVGVITEQECLAYGITGPILRATGRPWDLRKAFPYSGIEQYEFDVPVRSQGDVYDRYLVRLEEMRQSLRIVRQVAERMPDGDYRSEDRKVTPPPRARIDQSMEALIHHFKLFTEGFRVPEGEVYVSVESPRGELGCYLVSDGTSRPYRCHIRGPSFANLHALPIMMAGTSVADTIATIASVDPVMGDVDR
ncbi:MAG: NADH-quinone oxidoreductase subunit D [Actinomycetota bacterium]|nr:NADH-quinone oxidoreductase subunit D [Actinomycetota bacterium]